jgi:hypothetical protein
MKEWTIKVFKKENGQDVFEDWLAEQDVEAQEKIRARLDMMSITKTWDRPYFGNLGNHIHEVIVECKNKQYRPLGCFGIGPRLFILLIGATKTGGRKRGAIKWNPPNAIETAKNRRDLVMKDGRYLGDYKPREEKSNTTPKK